jgi:hypothetical protein
MQHSIHKHPVKHVAAFLYGSVGVFQRVKEALCKLNMQYLIDAEVL